MKVTRYIFAGLLVCLLALPAHFASAADGAFIPVTEKVDELNNDGDCSLREAIQAANTNQAVDNCPAGKAAGQDLIYLMPGEYKLTRTGDPEDGNVTGDLDITSPMILQGFGPEKTIIDARGNNRVLHILTALNVTLERLTITGGDTGGENVPMGGGLYVDKTNVSLIDAVVSNNSAAQLGGGMFINILVDTDPYTVTFVRTKFIENTANFGGGVFSYGRLESQDSQFVGNQASLSGGGVYNLGGTEDYSGILKVNNSLFWQNSGGVAGGGLNNGGAAQLTNTTFSANTVPLDAADPDGGGVFSDGNSLTFDHVTLVNNGGGGFTLNGTAQIANTLLVNNTGGNCNLRELLGYDSLDYNLESDDTCHFDQAHDLINVANPRVGPLQDNGGPTMTHALQSSSPAVDAANPGACPDVDQRSAVRPVDGNNNGSNGCDIGAFEAGSTAPPVPNAEIPINYLPQTSK